MAKTYRELHDQVVARPGAEARLVALREQTLAEIRLHGLRRSRAVSQAELAARLEITQPAVSKFERAEDLKVSTLRDYIEALGGTLELCAIFGDDVIPLDLGDRNGA